MGNFYPFVNSLANRLLALILSPKNTNTHGTAVSPIAMLPNSAPALASPRFVNKNPVTSGKIPPSTFRQNDCAASAEEAYLWYVSAR